MLIATWNPNSILEDKTPKKYGGGGKELQKRKIKREKWRIGLFPRIRPINAFDPRGPVLPLNAVST